MDQIAVLMAGLFHAAGAVVHAQSVYDPFIWISHMWGPCS